MVHFTLYMIWPQITPYPHLSHLHSFLASLAPVLSRSTPESIPTLSILPRMFPRYTHVDTVLVWVSVGVMKHHDRKVTWGGKGLLCLYFQIIVYR